MNKLNLNSSTIQWIVCILLFEVLLCRQLDSDSQYFLKFSYIPKYPAYFHIPKYPAYLRPRISPQPNATSYEEGKGGGIFWFRRRFEKIWCLFASFHCHLICTQEMKTLPKAKYWLALALVISISNWVLVFGRFGAFDHDHHMKSGKVRESFVCSWNLAQVSQHRDQH